MIVLQATHDIRKVSLWLGHATLTTTEVYTRGDPTEKLDAMEAIVPPHLRRGAFQLSDRLIALLKPPFGGPEQVFAYLGRYTHRVAIANSRLVSLTDTAVAFRWKDYRHHGNAKLMTLAANEFIRRFLLHTLPDGFHRIRHYGFLANSHRASKLALCHRLLDALIAEPSTEQAKGHSSTAQTRALPVLRRRHAEAGYPAATRSRSAALLE
jgi:hypothetical protein